MNAVGFVVEILLIECHQDAQRSVFHPFRVIAGEVVAVVARLELDAAGFAAFVLGRVLLVLMPAPHRSRRAKQLRVLERDQQSDSKHRSLHRCDSISRATRNDCRHMTP